MTVSVVARWWSPEDDGNVRCTLCPRRCLIARGRCGFCGVRRNDDGELHSLSYGHPVSAAIDPIEKKPLARFMPHSRTFSFGTFGCNLGCDFCQNDSLSRGHYRDFREIDYVPPEEMVDLALKHHCPSISYTYNEPTVFAEYVLDIATLAHKAGLKNVLVSNGFISDEVSDELYPLMDAANIDMKGWTAKFYEDYCSGTLSPVLNSLEKLHRLGVHLEVTTLVIPTRNDDEVSISGWLDWVETHLGLSQPLHFSAYHPACRCTLPPTPPETLYHIRDVARERGFEAVFLGNV